MVKEWNCSNYLFPQAAVWSVNLQRSFKTPEEKDSLGINPLLLSLLNNVEPSERILTVDNLLKRDLPESWDSQLLYRSFTFRFTLKIKHMIFKKKVMIATTAKIWKQIFHWVSIIIWLCIRFDSLISVIGLESAQYFNNRPIRCKINTNPAFVTRTPCDYGRMALCEILLCSDWLL